MSRNQAIWTDENWNGHLNTFCLLLLVIFQIKIMKIYLFFSRSVAKGFEHFGEVSKSEIIMIINDAYDVLNSSWPTHPYIKLKSAFGNNTIWH